MLMPTPEIAGLGLIGFSTNCLMVAMNLLGVEKKEPEKIAPGWGWAHVFTGALMLLTGLSVYITNAMGVAEISGYVGIALSYYAFYWMFLGTILVRAHDLRPIAQISIPYAITTLWFIAGSIRLGLVSLTILLAILVLVFLFLWPATHGGAAFVKINAILIIMMAILGFYIAFGLIYPKYTLF
jgi:succinate-acetate transporter protein